MSKDLLKEQRELFIQERTIEERKLDEFSKAIISVDTDDVFKDAYIPPVISLKALCPEAYEEFPNVEVYDKQFKEMCEVIANLNQKVINYNEEALKCMQEYKMMS